MRERPILFSAPMVQAVLNGRKTQTRRIVKFIPALGEPDQWCVTAEGQSSTIGDYRRFCPYGKPGDRLWVRESFCDSKGICEKRFAYKADGGRLPSGWQWKSPIHMPRAASRSTLEITGIRVERLQDISEADALAEGMQFRNADEDQDGAPDARQSRSYRQAFIDAWRDINGTDSWAANPWVWVIEFTNL